MLLLALTSPSVIVDVLLDPERDERAVDGTWANHHARITAQFARLSESKSAKRRTALRRFWNENITIVTDEYAELGIGSTPPGFSDKELAGALNSAPMLRYLSELFVQRFLDRKIRWKRNDLIDMMFLSCAAGYADYVVAETHTGTKLAQMQRSKASRRTVFTSLADLVDALHAGGVRTDTERRASEDPSAPPPPDR